MKKILKLRVAIIVACVALFFATCKKHNSIEYSYTNPNNTNITASVKGRIINEKNEPLNAVTITAGANTVTTNLNGEFQFTNIPLNSELAFITATKTGYFAGSRTFKARQSKTQFVDIMLIQRTEVGNISAVAGGAINLQNGAVISLPANGIVLQSSGVAYTGNVNVAMSWIDPTEKDLLHKMPGDLRGIDELGTEKILQTYGMLAVELTGTGGEKLQIAGGKKAGLKFPLPQKMQSTAPATIPLWSFNETNGLWQQEGVATKMGNVYVAEVSHFSWWNADFPYTNAATFNATFVDQNGKPLKWTQVSVTDATGNYTGAYGYTDETGFAQGRVPENMALKAHLNYYYSKCSSSSIGSISMGPFAANTDNSLGTKTLTIPIVNTYTATITGTLKDCSGKPAQSGYVVITHNNNFYNSVEYTYVNSDANGNFTSHIELCTTSTAITYYAADSIGNNVTATTNKIVNVGSNNLGTIVLCGTHRIKADVVDCRSLPVVAGYLYATIDGRGVYLPIKNGMLDFSFTPINQSPYIYYQAVNYATGETSPATGKVLSSGINNLGTLTTCITHTVSGNVVDCNNAPVNGGYVAISGAGLSYSAPIVNGSYTMSFTPSTSTANISYYAVAKNYYYQSNTATATVHLGGNTLPTIQICPTHTVVGKLVDCNGNPIAFSTFVLKTNNGSNYYQTTSEADGSFKLEFNASSNGTVTYYGQTNYLLGIPINGTITTGQNNFGNVLVCGTHTLKGTATDCNNNPLNNGYVTAIVNGYTYRQLVVNGNFNINFTPPTNNLSITYFVEDTVKGQASTNKTAAIVPGINNLGNTQACGINTAEFINYSVDGVAYPAIIQGQIYYDLSVQGKTNHYIRGSDAFNRSVGFNFSTNTIGSVDLDGFYFYNGTAYSSGFATGTKVNVTQLAANINEFTFGNFTTTYTDSSNLQTHTFNCDFKVRRKQ